jgi:hypothetical protein
MTKNVRPQLSRKKVFGAMGATKDRVVLHLWTFPIYLRTEEQYFQEGEARAARLIEAYWRTSGHRYRSRKEFDESDFLHNVRNQNQVLYWRLNDVVGWIEVLAFLKSKNVQVALYLADRRISRQLKVKSYRYEEMKHVLYSEDSNNEELRGKVLDIARGLVSRTGSIRDCYVDFEHLQRTLNWTDIIGLLNEAADS